MRGSDWGIYKSIVDMVISLQGLATKIDEKEIYETVWHILREARIKLEKVVE